MDRQEIIRAHRWKRFHEAVALCDRECDRFWHDYAEEAINERTIRQDARWAKARRQADRIALAIADDQLVAWALHPDGRRRNQALRGWADMLRSMAPA
jgi:predicted NodU family carbamoyl transferase